MTTVKVSFWTLLRECEELWTGLDGSVRTLSYEDIKKKFDCDLHVDPHTGMCTMIFKNDNNQMLTWLIMKTL